MPSFLPLTTGCCRTAANRSGTFTAHTTASMTECASVCRSTPSCMGMGYMDMAIGNCHLYNTSVGLDHAEPGDRCLVCCRCRESAAPWRAPSPSPTAPPTAILVTTAPTQGRCWEITVPATRINGCCRTANNTAGTYVAIGTNSMSECAGACKSQPNCFGMAYMDQDPAIGNCYLYNNPDAFHHAEEGGRCLVCCQCRTPAPTVRVTVPPTPVRTLSPTAVPTLSNSTSTTTSGIRATFAASGDVPALKAEVATWVSEAEVNVSTQPASSSGRRTASVIFSVCVNNENISDDDLRALVAMLADTDFASGASANASRAYDSQVSRICGKAVPTPVKPDSQSTSNGQEPVVVAMGAVVAVAVAAFALPFVLFGVYYFRTRKKKTFRTRQSKGTGDGASEMGTDATPDVNHDPDVDLAWDGLDAFGALRRMASRRMAWTRSEMPPNGQLLESIDLPKPRPVDRGFGIPHAIDDDHDESWMAAAMGVIIDSILPGARDGTSRDRANIVPDLQTKVRQQRADGPAEREGETSITTPMVHEQHRERILGTSSPEMCNQKHIYDTTS